jgi:Transglutaminase-like superfamily
LKRLRDRLQKLIHLQPRERFVLIEAWILFVAMDLALRMMPFKALLACLNASRLKRETNAHALHPSLPRLIYLVISAGRAVPVSVTCLKQALVLSWLLGRRGLRTTIQIGVSSQGGTFTAHAWLEKQGEVIFGLPGEERYHPLLPTVRSTSAS